MYATSFAENKYASIHFVFVGSSLRVNYVLKTNLNLHSCIKVAVKRWKALIHRTFVGMSIFTNTKSLYSILDQNDTIDTCEVPLFFKNNSPSTDLNKVSKLTSSLLDSTVHTRNWSLSLHFKTDLFLLLHKKAERPFEENVKLSLILIIQTFKKKIFNGALVFYIRH